jgi:hypothetical protein
MMNVALTVAENQAGNNQKNGVQMPPATPHETGFAFWTV